MIIGFDASQIMPGRAGGGFFAEGLLKGLAEFDSENEYILYSTFGDGVWDPAWPRFPPPVQRKNMRRGLGHRTRTELEDFWRATAIDERCLGDPDVVHSNNFYCPTGLRRARIVYTLYDLGFIEHPEWTTEANRLTCFSGVFNASIYADRILAISEYSRQHFLSTFPHYAAEQVTVVYPASRFPLDAGYARPRRLRDLDPNGFWLSVATLEPRKNHRRLLQAYARLRSATDDPPPLVLAGGEGWLMDNLGPELDSLGLRKSVRLLGYVDDQTLGWLYRNCLGFVYVSLFEGFGMPVLEAMSCGAPVIASNTTSLPEIVGSAGVLVDPLDVDSIARAMLQLGGHEHERLALKHSALSGASRFSWRQSASSVAQIYREFDESSK